MRFSADERLLEILVGSNLYPDPEVSVRELVQNAWDALEWRRAAGDDGGSEILVRFHGSESWIEVRDDGIGMDEVDFQESFLRVGRSKLEALGADAPPGEQVALFGIGVLSVFLVADAVTVQSRKLGAESGFEAHLTGLTDDFQVHPNPEVPIGTAVTLHLKSGVDARATAMVGVSKYVRHVPSVFLLDAETNTRTPATEQWSIEDAIGVRAIPPTSTLRSGRVGLSLGLADTSQVFRNRLTLCNAGFLVEEAAVDVLPDGLVLGLTGELDLHAGQLSIVMARERYQRDQSWEEFLGITLSMAEALIRESSFIETEESATQEGRAAARRALLIWHWQLSEHPIASTLLGDLSNRIWSDIEWSVADRSPKRLADLLALGPQKVYARRTDQAAQRARHIDDEGLPLQIVEDMRDSIRVAALMARGFSVIELGSLQVTMQTHSNTSTYSLSEFDLLSRVLVARGVELRDIAMAPPEDLDLSSIEQLPVLRSILDVNGQLRFASISDSERRTVSDPSGTRYLNVRNPTVKRLLRVIPLAVANPLRRRLLDAYLGLEDFRLADTRKALLELIEADDLAERAAVDTSPLSSAAVRRSIDRLLGELA